MKRRSVQRAYEHIRPDDEARERMLQNILNSSEIPPAGKDDTMKHKKMRLVLIAAIIALSILLMGSAVIAISLQEMKIGEYLSGKGEILDSDGNVLVEKEIVRDVISLQGFNSSPGMLASKEWFEFEQAYDADGQLIGDAEAAGYEAPRAYDAYLVFDQIMQDKIDEIANKYGLKLAGKQVLAQDYQSELVFDVLGIEDLHHEAPEVNVEYGSGYFYECGNFKIEFHVTMSDEVSDWPHEILAGMRYCDKAYLDTVYFTVNDIDRAEQWNYTTADGIDILIAMSGNQARFFCDREDAFVTVSLFIDYCSDSGEISYMSKEAVQQLAEYMDFAVNPQKPDMEVAIALLKKSEEEHLAATENNGYFSDYSDFVDEYGYLEFIEAGIAAAKYPEKNYYALVDIDGNGVVDLLLGGEEQCTNAWTVTNPHAYKQIALMPLTEDELNALNAQWSNMDIKPITEYITE